MTQTLTTDELRQIVETDHVQCGDAAAMARELLANREAQPVAIVESSAYVTAAQIIGDEPPMKAVKELYAGALVIGQNLYTAPPAPAVPNEMPDAAYAVLSKACGDNACLFADELWNACRAAMLAAATEGGN